MHLGGSVAIAAVAGVLGQSATLFLLVLAALVAASLASGEIRLPRR